jgi:flavin-dependent dehydrogenase
MDVGSVRLETPLHEMRIGAVIRGPGPRDIKERKWGSFDGHLLGLAESKGASIVRDRIDGVALMDGRPSLKTKGGSIDSFDLVAVATGVNSPALRLFESLGFGYRRPETTKTLIREYFLGEDVINESLGTSMHVFLLNIPRLQFAALIPKGDYVTMCLVGEDIDNSIAKAFVESPEVKQAMPEGWRSDERSCQCMPRMSICGVAKPFADCVVFIGDCGVTRLYKDGIGAAYRTARAAARTAVFEGVSEAAFRQHFLPTCRAIGKDNMFGKVAFAVTKQIQKRRFARRALLRMTANEQRKAGQQRRMSRVLWDMFTGSAPYSDVFCRTLHPAFIGRLLYSLAVSLNPIRNTGAAKRNAF